MAEQLELLFDAPSEAPATGREAVADAHSAWIRPRQRESTRRREKTGPERLSDGFDCNGRSYAVPPEAAGMAETLYLTATMSTSSP